MQTVLGAGGQIADEIVRYLHEHVTHDVRLVSRNPSKVHELDQLVRADLMDGDATSDAVAGSDIVYLTVGLPVDSSVWERCFPVIMANVIAACQKHGSKLVYFDNTYMYPQTAVPQTEDTGFEPIGRKAVVRARTATTLLDQMRAGSLEAVICRAPEFYGPGKTQGLTNSAVFDRMRQGKRPFVLVNARTRRSLIWTPDAARATALIGNTPDAYGQTWHLPVDPDRMTFEQLIEAASGITGRHIAYTTVPASLFRLVGRFVPPVGEAAELLPRYRVDNIFDSTKFTSAFPDFHITPYRVGIRELVQEP